MDAAPVDIVDAAPVDIVDAAPVDIVDAAPVDIVDAAPVDMPAVGKGGILETILSAGLDNYNKTILMLFLQLDVSIIMLLFSCIKSKIYTFNEWSCFINPEYGKLTHSGVTGGL